MGQPHLQKYFEIHRGQQSQMMPCAWVLQLFVFVLSYNFSADLVWTRGPQSANIMAFFKQFYALLVGFISTNSTIDIQCVAIAQ